jgi:hypothetical protein
MVTFAGHKGKRRLGQLMRSGRIQDGDAREVEQVVVEAAGSLACGRVDLQLDLRTGEIRTIIWATGYRPDYDWLDVPVVDSKGRLQHEGGVVDSPGLYALGLPVLRRRKSTFIYGIEDDAREVTDHLQQYLTAHR